MKFTFQCKESGLTAIVDIDPSKVSLQSVRDLETAASLELYAPLPLNLRYVPTLDMAVLNEACAMIMRFFK